MSEAQYCPLKNSDCNVIPEIAGGVTCFIAIPFRPEWQDTRDTVIKTLKKHNVAHYVADEDITTGRDILCKICEKITFADFGVIEASAINPNVMIEFGLTLGRRKPVFILRDKTVTAPSFPVDITALDRIEYSNQTTLEDQFDKGLRSYLTRFDASKKRIETLMQMIKASASTGALVEAESYFKALHSITRKSRSANELTVDALTHLYENSDPNSVLRVKYGATLAQFLSDSGDHEKAKMTFENMVASACEYVVIGFSKRNEIPEPIVKGDLDNLKLLQTEHLGVSVMSRMISETNLETFYARLWRCLYEMNEEQSKKFVGRLERLTLGQLSAFFFLFRRDVFVRPEGLCLAIWFVGAPTLESKGLDQHVKKVKKRAKAALPALIRRRRFGQIIR